MIKRNDVTKFRVRAINRDFEDDLNFVNRLISKKLIKPYLHIESLYGRYLNLAHYDLYLNNNESSCIEYLQNAAECNNAIYLLALHNEQDVTISLDGFEPIILPGKVNNTHIVPWEFVTQLRIMMLLRRKDIIKNMLDLPESLFDPEKAGLSGPEYHIIFYRVFKSFLLKDKSDEELLNHIESCQQVVKEYAEDNGDDYLTYYITFELQLLTSIIKKDTDLINKWLEIRLLQVKEYYKENTSHPFSLFALKDVGWAALCHDLGFEITVQSDYFPDFLVNGSFTEEKLTWPMV